MNNLNRREQTIALIMILSENIKLYYEENKPADDWYKAITDESINLLTHYVHRLNEKESKRLNEKLSKAFEYVIKRLENTKVNVSLNEIINIFDALIEDEKLNVTDERKKQQLNKVQDLLISNQDYNPNNFDELDSCNSLYEVLKNCFYAF